MHNHRSIVLVNFGKTLFSSLFLLSSNLYRLVYKVHKLFDHVKIVLASVVLKEKMLKFKNSDQLKAYVQYEQRLKLIFYDKGTNIAADETLQFYESFGNRNLALCFSRIYTW